MKAIVRKLTDDELVIAQGQENGDVVTSALSSARFLHPFSRSETSIATQLLRR